MFIGDFGGIELIWGVVISYTLNNFPALASPVNPNTAVSFGIGRDHDGPPIIPIRPIFSDPPSFRCPTSEFSCVEILRGVQTFRLLVAPYLRFCQNQRFFF